GLRQVGLGQLLLANFSPALEASDLAKYGSFVALVQSLARQLRPVAANVAQSFVGEPYRFAATFPAAPEAGKVMVLGPDGKETPFTSDIRSDKRTLFIPRPEQHGFYEVHRGK